jgi:hypothetical protein
MVEVATTESGKSRIGGFFGENLLETVVLRRDDVERVAGMEGWVLFPRFFFCGDFC